MKLCGATGCGVLQFPSSQRASYDGPRPSLRVLHCACGHRPGPDFYQPVAIVIRPIQELNFDSASNSAVIASIFPRLSFPAHILVVALVSLDMWQLAAQFTDACARI
jgi:hypothetical protein